MGDTSLSESPEEEDNDSPGPNGGDSLQDLLSSPANDWQGGPRKRTQTLPTFNCPLTGLAAKSEALNRWSRIHDITEEKSGTLSEDIFRTLDLQSLSLFSSPTLSAKQSEDKNKVQTGSEATTSSSSTDSPKCDRDHQPTQVVTPQPASVQAQVVSGVCQQENSRSEEEGEEEEQKQTQPTER